MSAGRPRVVVLLATFNGAAYLQEQVETILAQEDVEVRLVVSDDGSVDGSAAWLDELADEDDRVTVLPKAPPSGGAAANFYRLIRDAGIRDGELIAFADQDDVWLPRKLATQARLLAELGADAISGSVLAFEPGGRRRLVKKDYPQRRLDWLTESPGPGCTFLMTPRLLALVRRVLAEVPEAPRADFHDSLVYAIGRAAGLRWHIEGEPLVLYRQHESNVMGANQGLAGARTRLEMIRAHWHREQAIVHALAGLAVADDERRADLDRVLPLLRSRSLRDRRALARLAPQLRRRPRDRFVIGTLIRLGIW